MSKFGERFGEAPADDGDAMRLIERLRSIPIRLSTTTSGDARKTLRSWLAEIDRALSSQLAAIMHAPPFQKLEAAWRGLYYLVHRPEACDGLRIKLLNVTRTELQTDLRKAFAFDQSRLFKKVYEEEYGLRCGEPYGLLIGDYEFSHAAEDMEMLRYLSGVAAESHAPLVANASPAMFDLERFPQLARPRNLISVFQGEEYKAWQSFRDAEDSRYVALTLPRVLGRLPYAPGAGTADDFHFDETAGGLDHNKFLWMGAAWAYAAIVVDAYTKHGWMARTLGVEGGGKVEGLPVHPFPTDDGDAAVSPCEIAVMDRRESELSSLGFLVLGHNMNNECAVFMDAQSCSKPRTYADEDATAGAQLSARLNYLLCVSGFARALKMMARHLTRDDMEMQERPPRLNRWIDAYTLRNPTPEDRNGERGTEMPLLDSIVLVRQRGKEPPHLVVWLCPYFQLGELPPALMRLIVYVPQMSGLTTLNLAWLRWNDGMVGRIAKAIAADNRFADLPILADALDEAGCTNDHITDHCRYPHNGPGCWVVDALLETVRRMSSGLADGAK